MRKFGHPDDAIKYGVKLGTEAHVTSVKWHHVVAILAAISAGAILPAATNNGPQLGPQLDQGPTGSCTGHGTSGACTLSANTAGLPLPFVPSPRGAYDVGRCIDRTPDQNGNFPPLEDGGSSSDSVCQGVNQWGIRAMSPPTVTDPDGTVRVSDCSAANINTEPTLGDLVNDDSVHLPTPYSITSTGAQRVTDVKTALAAHGDGTGYAVGITIYADTTGPRSVEEWDPSTGPLDAPNHADQAGGYHWVYIYDYYTDSNGNTVFKWRNSWGTFWGVTGNGLGSEAWLQDISSLKVFAIPRAAAQKAAA